MRPAIIYYFSWIFSFEVLGGSSGHSKIATDEMVCSTVSFRGLEVQATMAEKTGEDDADKSMSYDISIADENKCRGFEVKISSGKKNVEVYPFCESYQGINLDFYLVGKIVSNTRYFEINKEEVHNIRSLYSSYLSDDVSFYRNNIQAAVAGHEQKLRQYIFLPSEYDDSVIANIEETQYRIKNIGIEFEKVIKDKVLLNEYIKKRNSEAEAAAGLESSHEYQNEKKGYPIREKGASDVDNYLICTVVRTYQEEICPENKKSLRTMTYVLEIANPTFSLHKSFLRHLSQTKMNLLRGSLRSCIDNRR